jgi:hypothetical protein
MPSELLPSNALAGSRLGIAVSDSPDLERLGLLEVHFRLALGEITRAIVVSGGGIVYGGHPDPDGYTAFVVTELQRYAYRNRPLLVCLAWPEHRRRKLSDLELFRRDLGLYGRMVCLDIDGQEIDMAVGRGEAACPVDDPPTVHRSLTGLRRYMRTHERGRVFIGGRRNGFFGPVPGLIEEALVCLRTHEPIYLAAGFGGVTLDIARALGVDAGDWLPAEDDAAAEVSGLVEGRRQLRDFAGSADWHGLDNGLTPEENGWLAASHRPGDIAALVSLGIGRLAQRSAQTGPHCGPG